MLVFRKTLRTEGIIPKEKLVIALDLLRSFHIKASGQACNFIKKETLALVLSCEFCEISKNTSVDCFC